LHVLPNYYEQVDRKHKEEKCAKSSPPDALLHHCLWICCHLRFQMFNIKDLMNTCERLVLNLFHNSAVTLVFTICKESHRYKPKILFANWKCLQVVEKCHFRNYTAWHTSIVAVRSKNAMTSWRLRRAKLTIQYRTETATSVGKEEQNRNTYYAYNYKLLVPINTILQSLRL